ncbi:glycosyltransferase [Acetobacter orleanensis]|uniref:Glycosyl transferase n=1 Tax=Acetobacter orleanensis TaxID=104099 RepID=A0A4Y3TLU5_9PROT|nr:glycosyltransferase [Acetobacter orleanensis]KXV63527.1 hypothetical protein AD949_06935 [Acetobacter orleanensis]PCD79912.1 glycosyl transferase family 2 [Acetobacter orleanensis]GAN68215.1 glycosyl transferase group 2 [Acetobacter orleanensis JCM 7639]GBR31379.1 putative glycosyltransferase [Acetobacter orleanensis NRIC 0473]GEB82892.1 glycosyl transferase [Acetobacter orleanensis]
MLPSTAPRADQTPCRVTAVIVTCNRLSMLKTVLDHTLAQNFSAVVVVNNASQDGTRDWLETQTDPRLHCLHEPINSGGAGGFARGMDYAAHQTGCDWLVCFDDDAWPQPGALNLFQSLPLPPSVGAVAAAVYFPSGAVCDMNRPGINPFASIGKFFQLVKSRKRTFAIDPAAYQQSKAVPVDYASFVGFFVRADLVRGPLGLPQKDLFIYADDTLYAWKLRCLGQKILFVPGIRFTHDCKTTVSFARNRWKIYYIVRNRILFYKKIAGWLFAPFAPLLLLSVLKLYCKNRHTPHIRALILAGLRDGLRSDTSRTHTNIMALSGES